MRTKLTLALTLVIGSVAPAMAFWNCTTVPEIDGPAGISALAALASFGIIAYQRARSR